MSCKVITCQICIIWCRMALFFFSFLFSSEPDVPDVILGSKSCQLRGSRSTGNGSSHSQNDGIGGHSWPCGTGDMQKLCNQNLCQLYQFFPFNYPTKLNNPLSFRAFTDTPQTHPGMFLTLKRCYMTKASLLWPISLLTRWEYVCGGTLWV